MFKALGILLFLCASALADPTRYELRSTDAQGIRKAGISAVAGDTIVLDGKEYFIEKKLGSGSYGSVFKVKVDGRTEALKLLIEEDLIGRPHDRNSLVSQAGALKEWKGTVPVPDIYESPAHGNYLRMEYIEGETLRARLYHSTEPAERIAEFRRLDQLWKELEASPLHPQLQNIAVNVVYSEARGKYVLLDPDHFTRDGKLEPFTNTGFPEVAGMIRFERHVREGKFPDSAKRLAGKGEALSSTGQTSPEWMLEFLANTDLAYFGEEMSRMVEWETFSPERTEALRSRMTEIARTKIAGLGQRPDISVFESDGAVLEILLANPLFRDAEVAEQYLQRVPQVQLLFALQKVTKPLRHVAERPWFKDFVLKKNLEGFPEWLKAGVTEMPGLSYLAAHELLRDIVKPGFDRSPQQLIAELSKNDFALFHRLSEAQVALLLRLAITQAEALPVAERLNLFQAIRSAEASAAVRERAWLLDLDSEQTLFLYRTARDPETSSALRAQAVRLGGAEFGEDGLEGVLVRGNITPEIKVAVLEELGKSSVLSHIGFNIVNDGLRDPDLSVQRAARSARDNLAKTSSDRSHVFHRDSWKLWFADICGFVTQTAAKE